MKIKSIPSNWIEIEGRRLDCGPYMSGAFETRLLLKKLKVPKDCLQNLTKNGIDGIINAGRISRVWVDDQENGYPFLSSTDILQADMTSTSFIAKSVARQNRHLIIKKNWTLITRSGSIGNMAYARADMDGTACTEDILRIVPDEDKILPGYIYAYLNTKFGIPLVSSGTYGSVITHLEPHHLADLPVPRLGSVEEQVHELIQGAADKLTEYQTLVNEASINVIKNCGISNPSRSEWFSNPSDLGFTISNKELGGVLRAWNHSRRANRLKEQIKAGKWDELVNLVDFEWLRWRVMFTRIIVEPEYGIEVLTQKPLFRLFPEGKWISKEYLLNLSPKYVVPDETIMIAKQGTLGENELYCRCEFITGTKALERAYSDHCMRVVVKDDAIHPGYLFAFLRSEVGFRLLRNLSEGSKQQDLHWRTVATLPIPRCDREIENDIGEKIRKAYQLRNEAIEMIERGTSLIEKTIEEAAQ